MSERYFVQRTKGAPKTRNGFGVLGFFVRMIWSCKDLEETFQTGLHKSILRETITYVQWKRESLSKHKLHCLQITGWWHVGLLFHCLDFYGAVHCLNTWSVNDGKSWLLCWTHDPKAWSALEENNHICQESKPGKQFSLFFIGMSRTYW